MTADLRDAGQPRLLGTSRLQRARAQARHALDMHAAPIIGDDDVRDTYPYRLGWRSSDADRLAEALAALLELTT